MPGVIALTPPKTAARGREQDRLLVYLLLTGNSTITLNEYRKLAEDAAHIFYQTPRATTSALRAAADMINKTLLERNLSTSSRGQYALAWLSMAAIRESQCIFSISGPMHAYWFGQKEARHIFDPSISGKGLGSSQTLNIHYAQSDLAPGDLMLFCGRLPGAWAAPLEEVRSASFDAMRRRLVALTSEDLNAVLLQAADGNGSFNLKGIPAPKVEAPKVETLNVEETSIEETPLPSPTEDLPPVKEAESTPAHVLQPSAYAIPPEQEEARPIDQPRPDPLASLPRNTAPREFPSSIPRAKSVVEEANVPTPTPTKPETAAATEVPAELDSTPEKPIEIKRRVRREPSAQTKQAARIIVNSMQALRRWSGVFGEKTRNFLPRLLPNSDAGDTLKITDFSMFVISILVPLVIATILFVVYSKYGRNPQFESYLQQAQQVSQQAPTLGSPIEQREAWNQVIYLVSSAEEIYRPTSESLALRQTAEANLDILFGITRMQFNPAFSAKINIEISRMAASEKDLYLLNAANGEVLRAIPSGNGGFEIDTTFVCKPGVYGSYTVGPLVDILAMPIVNFIDATLLGIDAAGNLLYCKPGEVPQAIPLPPPDTNWGRVTGFTLDAGNLYVLDAPARAVWVYVGKESTFVDRPYFFFGQQTPSQDVIDLVVAGDEMFLLHADGRLSNCSYNRIDASKSQCQEQTILVNPFPAYQDTNLFGTAHFTQILFAAPPDPSILLLDSDSQSVMRFASRSLELRNQFRPATGNANPVPAGSIGAVAVSPDHVLYIAVNGQVYFAVNMP